MRKTLLFLIVAAILGMVAAYEVPSGKSMASTGSGNSNSRVATPVPPATSQPHVTSTSQYKDGTYTGSVATNRFDEIQVSVVIRGGKISDVTTPILIGDSGQSDSINGYAVPQLNEQVLGAQSSAIDGVSGASATSQSYGESLQSAIDKAMA